MPLTVLIDNTRIIESTNHDEKYTVKDFLCMKIILFYFSS